MKVLLACLFLTLASLNLSTGIEIIAEDSRNVRNLLVADATFGGCIEVKDGKTTNGTPMIYGNCSNYRNGVDEKAWGGGLVRFVSRRDNSMCMQAGLKKSTLKSLDAVKLYKCSDTNILQRFKWYGDGIQTAYKPKLCVTYQGNTPEKGKDAIIVKECNRVPSGWSYD